MFGCGKQKKFHKRKVVCSNPGNGVNVVNLGKGTGRLNNDVARLNLDITRVPRQVIPLPRTVLWSRLDLNLVHLSRS